MYQSLLNYVSQPTRFSCFKDCLAFFEFSYRNLVCEYLEETAGMVNSWYHAGNPTRNPELAVLVPDPALRAARLVLARGVQVVLRNGLELLGLVAPERMEREESA